MQNQKVKFGNGGKPELTSADTEKQSADKHCIKTCVKNFLYTSTVKGVSKATKTDFISIRLLWLAAVVFGFTFATYQLYNLFKGYYSYNSVTKLNHCNDCKPPFPDVTLCNLNPLLFLQEWGEGLQMTYPDFYADLEENIANTNWTSFMEENNVYTDEIGFALHELRSLETYIQNALGNIDEEEAMLLFFSEHGTNFLIHDCRWYDWNHMEYWRENCRSHSIFNTYNSDYLQCYTIHLNGTHLRHDGYESDVSAFEATLYLHDFPQTNVEYTSSHIFRSQALGARILVHPPDTYPFMKDGFDIPPGHEVIVNLDAERYERAPDPYSSCSNRKYIEDISGYPSAVQSQMIRYRYTDVSAMYRCWQEECIKTCGCFNHYLPTTAGLAYEYPGVDLCSQMFFEHDQITNLTDSVEKIICYFNLYVDISNGDHEDNCFYNLPCKEYKYKTNVMMTTWPHQSHHLALYKGLINSTDPRAHKFGDYFRVYDDIAEAMTRNASEGFRRLLETDLIQRNFIQLKVQFVGKGETISTDVPSLSRELLFGSLGGILNLWIGITFITMVEILELVIHLIWHLHAGQKLKRNFFSQSKRRVPDVWDQNIPAVTPK